MKTSLMQKLVRDSDYYYDQKKYTQGCGNLKSLTISFEYNRNVFLEFNKYPELLPITEQLLSSDSEWLDVSGEPEWCENNIYRVKPEVAGLKWTDLCVSDIIKKGNRTAMVLQIDSDDATDLHIYAGNSWLADNVLVDWRKANDKVRG